MKPQMEVMDLKTDQQILAGSLNGGMGGTPDSPARGREFDDWEEFM